ncbi:fimbrial protein [Pseudomonas sp. IT-P176]|uniref:fimbrial protein n=1 Tax=Pseudomonas sp. IT-P176 TaxID=3026444 RepID=UPI0039E0ACDB
MQRKSLALAALVCATGAQFANASDGTINFNGELMNQSCTISVNGVVSPTVATVTLPTISTSQLTVAGQTSYHTNFNIQLHKCVSVSGRTFTAAAFFEAGSTVDPLSGNLKNVSGTAGNVQLQLVDPVTGTPIKAGSTTQRAQTTRNTIVGDAADMAYAVRYYATGATTAGTVVGSVTFSVDYL